MVTEPKPPFYTSSSGRTTLRSNGSTRMMCVTIGDEVFQLDVSSISKDYMRKYADKIDKLVAWVECKTRNELPNLSVAEIDIVDGRGAVAVLQE